MKKIILLLLLVIVSVTASARKSYITVVAHPYSGDDYWSMLLSGDVPTDIPNIVPADIDDGQDDGYWISRSYSIGQMLNILSGYGYEIELMVPVSDHNYQKVHYLLSKEISSGQTISKGDVNTDGEVNIADVNEVISLILGIVREHPEILEQIKKQTNN